MSLTQALGAAASGLRTAQSGLATVAANVANAQTAGYTRKTVSMQTVSGTGDVVSVRVSSVDRTLDQYVQRQLRTESSGSAYADLRAELYQRLQNVHGTPNGPTTVETLFNQFTSSLQALSTNPSDYTARTNVLNTAQALAQQLNTASVEIQALRENTELGLSDSVQSANDLMQSLAKINRQLTASYDDDAAKANLLDQRDTCLDRLAQLMDIRVIVDGTGAANVFTGSGTQLVGAQAARFAFDPAGMLSPTSRWNADPSKSQVGTILLTSPTGANIDLIAAKAFRSGRIAAYLEMRDDALVQAQQQIDEFAGALARSLSDQTVTQARPAATPPFAMSTTGVRPGDSMRITMTDGLGNPQAVTVVFSDGKPSAPVTAGQPGDRVVTVDWSQGITAAADELNFLFGGALTFSASGATLSVTDHTGQVNSAALTTTAATLTDGTPSLPFFSDGHSAYTGSIGSSGAQVVGFAGRIAVNPSLLADPSRLVVFQTSPQTPAGDTTRVDFMIDRLTSSAQAFGAATGVGTSSAPYSGTLSSFLRQAMSQQGAAASNADRLAEGQKMVVDALQQRFDESASVNVDQEMTTLLTLQNAYGANARVFSTVNEMLKTLMQMM